MSYEEWLSERQPSAEGKLPADSITKLPEISTLFGVSRHWKIKPAIGIELFHRRDRPRLHRWKFELQIAEEELAFGISRIIVPVVNFTVGPYIGRDFKYNETVYGVRFGIFKF